MTLRSHKTRLRPALALFVCLVAASLDVPLFAQLNQNATLRVTASIGSWIAVTFDRTAVTFATNAYDPSTVTSVFAAPLTVTAKARVDARTRVVLTVQADGPFRSGTDTIPENKLTWTMAGPGFHANGTANAAAARVIGSWRGSGIWTGTQVYEFADSWSYAVGVYTLQMTYTFTAP
jgi:hypothetical protein